ncbi:MAG TPA: amidase [Candidatus Angelobacter sp.]|nr:amidase [Candidatus Angelobacter sp.]
MPIIDDAALAPATELVERLRGGSVSPVELVDAVLERIERHNPTINAYVLVLAEQARQQARESEERIRRGEARPLEGLPVAIKDNVHLAGTPMTLASEAVKAAPSPVDSYVVRRLREAGAVLVGKTNLPELGTVPSTENRRFGATRNPWNTGLIAGGSSGGSAAAVAAGMAPAAHGNDAGGSLRIPAACTGLFSIKPTRGRISMAPAGDPPFGLNVEGFITRSVGDTAMLLDATHGSEPGDLHVAAPPARPFATEVGVNPGRLRIGFTAKPPLDVPIDAAYLDGLRRAATLCEQLGHDVVEIEPQWQNDDILGLFNQVWAAFFGNVVQEVIDSGGDLERIEPLNRALYELSKEISSAQYWRASTQMQALIRDIGAGQAEYDVVLTPALAKPPIPIGALWEGSDLDATMPIINSAMFTPFTVPANLSGQPAANLPLFEHEGLPLCVQAIGRLGEEATLIRLASQLETALPWAQRRPPLH